MLTWLVNSFVAHLGLGRVQKQGFGQVVIVNSVFGLAVGVPNFAVYAASKFALTGLAEGLRLEVKGSGIKVGSVLPGAVDTDM